MDEGSGVPEVFQSEEVGSPDRVDDTGEADAGSVNGGPDVDDTDDVG